MKTTINSGPVDEDRAHEIMGKNFFGVYDAVKHLLSVVPTEEQCEFLDRVPFSEETLRECKDTHVLVAVFPMSILDIRAMPLDVVNGHASKQSEGSLFRRQGWYDNQAFAMDKGEVGWQLVRKEPVVDSYKKTWQQQCVLLSKEEEIPTARILVYTLVGHFISTGECLFGDLYVRCVGNHFDDGRLLLGYFGIKGLLIDSWEADDCSYELRLSAARKRDF